MVVEASVVGLEFFRPILAFVAVFVIMFAILMKSKIVGEEKFIQLLLAFVVATIFVLAPGTRELVLDVVPWFVVLLVALFFVLALAGFIGKPGDMVGKGVGWIFIILLAIVFLTAGFDIFRREPFVWAIKDLFDSPRVVGAIVLMVVAGIVSWILVKKSK